MLYLIIFLIFSAGLTNYVVNWNVVFKIIKEKLKLDYEPFRDKKGSANLDTYQKSGESWFKIQLRVLFNCPICLGFWVGMLVHLGFYFMGFYLAITPFLLIDLLIYGVMSSVSSNFFSK